jgi:hypothetical protein
LPSVYNPVCSLLQGQCALSMNSIASILNHALYIVLWLGLVCYMVVLYWALLIPGFLTCSSPEQIFPIIDYTSVQRFRYWLKKSTGISFSN